MSIDEQTLSQVNTHTVKPLSATNTCQPFTRQHVKILFLPSVESPTGVNATLTSSPMSHSGVTGTRKQVQTACHGDLTAVCANLRRLITETFNCHNIPERRAADMRRDEATTRSRPNQACLPTCTGQSQVKKSQKELPCPCCVVPFDCKCRSKTSQ